MAEREVPTRHLMKTQLTQNWINKTGGIFSPICQKLETSSLDYQGNFFFRSTVFMQI